MDNYRASPCLEDCASLILAENREWMELLNHLTNYPKEAMAVGFNGRNVLHTACAHGAPARVVEQVLQVFPEAAIRIDNSNMTPLHICCSSSRALVDVCNVLLQRGPAIQSFLQDIDGDLPLHAACRSNAPIQMLELLLQAYPGGVNSRDREDLTPMHRLWVRHYVLMGKDALESIRDRSDMTQELQDTWAKTELLLKCSHYGSLDAMEIDDFQILHAAASIDCPRIVLDLAIKLYPDELRRRNDDGLSPLHVATCAPRFVDQDLTNEGYREEEIWENRQFGATIRPVVEPTSASQRSVIGYLVRAAPDQAAAMDQSGRIPLHLAIANGKTWSDGIKNLMEAYPTSLSRPDPVTQLYPFLLAAAEGDNVSLDTTFQLLRQHPTLLMQTR